MLADTMSSFIFSTQERLREIRLYMSTLTGFQRVMTVVVAILTLINAAFTTFTDPTNPDNPTLAQLHSPLDIARMGDDLQIRNDLSFILNRSRLNSGRSILTPHVGLDREAQNWAQRNAATHSFLPAPHNTIMVQTALPSTEATAARFLDLWFHDSASQRALATHHAQFIGVGVASADNTTYAVIQLRP